MIRSETVLDIFKELTTIPRESGHEGPVTRWLEQWASAHGLACKTDKAGNVLIVRPAAAGKTHIPPIVLQAHQDMVCEKLDGVVHDFAKDPIRYEIEDGWMIARDMTLGADDGIGIAACLAVLADPTPTGPVECLFTVSEETGMDGAFALEEGFFTGRTLINLDSEDEGQLFIGCAGGLNTNVRFSYHTETLPEGFSFLKISISGGVGGHSGDDINKGRANTVQLMARFLYASLAWDLRLVSIRGGGKPNAIARECEAVVAVPDPSRLEGAFRQFVQDIREEYHRTDPDLQGSVLPCAEDPAVEKELARRVIAALFSCPHGVETMSQDIEGLVQTSSNLASVRMDRENAEIEIVTSQRSASESERRTMAAKVRAHFEPAGARVRHLYEYPGWNPNLHSPILAQSVAAYRRLFSREPEVKAIHAGLECGLFLEKFPGLDMISFGPTLRGVHAPGEKLELASLDRFIRLLEDIIVNFS